METKEQAVRYKAYWKGTVIGPMEAAELVEQPWFNERVLVCPESTTGIRVEDWKKAREVPEFLRELAAFKGEGLPSPDAPPSQPAGWLGGDGKQSAGRSVSLRARLIKIEEDLPKLEEKTTAQEERLAATTARLESAMAGNNKRLEAEFQAVIEAAVKTKALAEGLKKSQEESFRRVNEETLHIRRHFESALAGALEKIMAQSAKTEELFGVSARWSQEVQNLTSRLEGFEKRSDASAQNLSARLDGFEKRSGVSAQEFSARLDELEKRSDISAQNLVARLDGLEKTLSALAQELGSRLEDLGKRSEAAAQELGSRLEQYCRRFDQDLRSLTEASGQSQSAAECLKVHQELEQKLSQGMADLEKNVQSSLQEFRIESSAHSQRLDEMLKAAAPSGPPAGEAGPPAELPESLKSAIGAIAGFQEIAKTLEKKAGENSEQLRQEKTKLEQKLKVLETYLAKFQKAQTVQDQLVKSLENRIAAIQKTGIKPAAPGPAAKSKYLKILIPAAAGAAVLAGILIFWAWRRPLPEESAPAFIEPAQETRTIPLPPAKQGKKPSSLEELPGIPKAPSPGKSPAQSPAKTEDQQFDFFE